jgi:hypothetical protein
MTGSTQDIFIIGPVLMFLILITILSIVFCDIGTETECPQRDNVVFAHPIEANAVDDNMIVVEGEPI